MDVPAMFRAAVAEFDSRVQQIGDHQWTAATPDEGWSVRDLVNHVTGEDLWAPPLLGGEPFDLIDGRFPEDTDDLLGDDPVTGWESAADAALSAFAEDDALVRRHLGASGDQVADPSGERRQSQHCAGSLGVKMIDLLGGSLECIRHERIDAKQIERVVPAKLIVGEQLTEQFYGRVKTCRCCRRGDRTAIA